jgi:TRAP-type uncharacterized transport system substrate-binding protein
MADLRGKKVDFGDAGSAGSLTAPILFRHFDIEVKETPLPAPYTVGAYMKVAAGEVDAAVRVVGKPVLTSRIFRPIRACTWCRSRSQRPSPSITP